MAYWQIELVPLDATIWARESRILEGLIIKAEDQRTARNRVWELALAFKMYGLNFDDRGFNLIKGKHYNLIINSLDVFND